jgi:hypothetical protein
MFDHHPFQVSDMNVPISMAVLARVPRAHATQVAPVDHCPQLRCFLGLPHLQEQTAASILAMAWAKIPSVTPLVEVARPSITLRAAVYDHS